MKTILYHKIQTVFAITYNNNQVGGIYLLLYLQLNFKFVFSTKSSN